MRFYETIHGVYFDDLDAFQILHNARYVVLMERTIGSFWKHLGSAGILDFEQFPDMSHLVRANHIEYDRPVTGISDVRVRIWVEKLGTTSLTFGFRVLPVDEDVDYAHGTRVLVRVDHETRKPVPWTDALRAKLAPYRLDVDR
jgi:acyl-CoA thioester hydrolase